MKDFSVKVEKSKILKGKYLLWITRQYVVKYLTMEQLRQIENTITDFRGTQDVQAETRDSKPDGKEYDVFRAAYKRYTDQLKQEVIAEFEGKQDAQDKTPAPSFYELMEEVENSIAPLDKYEQLLESHPEVLVNEVFKTFEQVILLKGLNDCDIYFLDVHIERAVHFYNRIREKRLGEVLFEDKDSVTFIGDN